MFICEVVGIIAFAVAGSLIGVQKNLDIFGVIILAITTAVGGGIFRDIMLGNTPPMIFKNPNYLFLSIISAIPVCLIYKKISKYNTVINVFDAIGLGAFAASGSNMALQYDGNTLLMIITIAVITGVGGGAIRDVMVKEIPFIFCKEIYALAVIIGAFSFYLTYPYLPQPLPMYVCFFVTTTVRLVSIKYNLNLPPVSKQIDGINIWEKMKNQFCLKH
ncbi:MAG: trimeric intracellular cation channel family protein [Veillonellales bacterium]